MSTGQPLQEMCYEEFTVFQLPLYHGPIVNIKIGDTTYNVSKGLLCKHSPYFTAMFDGKFKEGGEQSAELEELEGVISNRSFQLLLQWLYIGRIIMSKESPSDLISAMIEFARLADMLKISKVESQIAEHIRATVLANPPPGYNWSRSGETNVYHITSGHIHAATRLPQGHLVRRLFAKAAVDAYLNSSEFRFAKEIRAIPEFAADLLEELKVAVKSVRISNCDITYFTDPFSGEEIRFRP